MADYFTPYVGISFSVERVAYVLELQYLLYRLPRSPKKDLLRGVSVSGDIPQISRFLKKLSQHYFHNIWPPRYLLYAAKKNAPHDAALHSSHRANGERSRVGRNFPKGETL